jgi:molybdopterin molybdotransferase
MIPVEQHLARILDLCRPLPSLRLGLLDAQGCTLAEDVVSEVELPGFRNSAMDGYAVHASDVAGASQESGVRLPVVHDIAAGNTQVLSLASGQTMRIMTGAPVPAGADAVVPVEVTDRGVARVTIHRDAAAGEHIREAGVDVRRGDVILRTGTLLGPRHLALLAAVGRGSAQVVPKPRVVVLSTGDELIEPGTRPGFGQVVDSNGIMIASAVRAVGAVSYRVGIVRDDARALRTVLEDQLVRADVLITTGGVSAGAYDTVKEVLSSVGTVQFDKVAMQPGMPQGFGTLRPAAGGDGVPVFTLPGNPVSAMVSFQVFVAPGLRQLAGRPSRETVLVPAVTERGWTSPAGKTQFARVTLTRRDDGTFTAALAGGQGSYVLGGLAAANALAVIPADVTLVQAGETVQCHPLDLAPEML